MDRCKCGGNYIIIREKNQVTDNIVVHYECERCKNRLGEINE